MLSGIFHSDPFLDLHEGPKGALPLSTNGRQGVEVERPGPKSSFRDGLGLGSRKTKPGSIFQIPRPPLPSTPRRGSSIFELVDGTRGRKLLFKV